MDGVEVELGHASQQGRRGWRRGDHRRHCLLQTTGAGMIDDHLVHGGRAAVVRHSLVVDELPNQGGVHRAHRHMSSADRSYRPREAPAVAVEHRQGPQVRRLGRHPSGDHLAERIEIRTAVCVLDTLWLPRGAGGVVDRDGLLFILEPALRLRWGRGIQERLILISRGRGVSTPDDRHAGQIQRGEHRLELRVDQQKTRIAVSEDVPHLGTCEPVVDRDEDPTGRRDTEMGLEHRRRVEQQRRHSISLAQPRRPERICESPRSLRELAVGVSAIPLHHRGLPGIHVGGSPEKIDGIQLRAKHLTPDAIPLGDGSGPNRRVDHAPPSR